MSAPKPKCSNCGLVYSATQTEAMHKRARLNTPGGACPPNELLVRVPSPRAGPHYSHGGKYPVRRPAGKGPQRPAPAPASTPSPRLPVKRNIAPQYEESQPEDSPDEEENGEDEDDEGDLDVVSSPAPMPSPPKKAPRPKRKDEVPSPCTFCGHVLASGRNLAKHLECRERNGECPKAAIRCGATCVSLVSVFFDLAL
jgi:hypothetical protein